MRQTNHGQQSFKKSVPLKRLIARIKPHGSNDSSYLFLLHVSLLSPRQAPLRACFVKTFGDVGIPYVIR